MFTVVKSVSSFNEIARDLRGCGSLALPVDIVPAFLDYCEMFTSLRPSAGALCGPESSPLQWLYL